MRIKGLIYRCVCPPASSLHLTSTCPAENQSPFTTKPSPPCPCTPQGALFLKCLSSQLPNPLGSLQNPAQISTPSRKSPLGGVLICETRGQLMVPVNYVPLHDKVTLQV